MADIDRRISGGQIAKSLANFTVAWNFDPLKDDGRGGDHDGHVEKGREAAGGAGVAAHGPFIEPPQDRDVEDVERVAGFTEEIHDGAGEGTGECAASPGEADEGEDVEGAEAGVEVPVSAVHPLGVEDEGDSSHGGGQVKPGTAVGEAGGSEVEDAGRDDAGGEVGEVVDGLPVPGDAVVGHGGGGDDGDDEDEGKRPVPCSLDDRQQQGEAEVENELAGEGPGGRVPADVEVAFPALEDEEIVDEEADFGLKGAGGLVHRTPDEGRHDEQAEEVDGVDAGEAGSAIADERALVPDGFGVALGEDETGEDEEGLNGEVAIADEQARHGGQGEDERFQHHALSGYMVQDDPQREDETHAGESRQIGRLRSRGKGRSGLLNGSGDSAIVSSGGFTHEDWRDDAAGV